MGEPSLALSQQPRLHHVGIIVPDMHQVEALMSLLGFRPGITQYVPRYQADCIFTKGHGVAIEFIIPRGGPLARFNKGMGGIHHIAVEVDDLDILATDLAREEIKLLEEQPVDAGRLWINFLPPAYSRGIIVEYVQTKTSDQASPGADRVPDSSADSNDETADPSREPPPVP